MPKYLGKRALTLRTNQIKSTYHKVRTQHETIAQRIIKETQELSSNPKTFFEKNLGFTPYGYQADFVKMFQQSQFTAARWCRQSGKTFIIAATLLWYAATHANSAICIVGPSWRQTKRILTRIALFTHRLPPDIALKSQKTQIRFNNGSIIEAFPNNPETIRGPTFDVVYCDEFNFVSDDQELYDAILYTLGATDGKFVCSSTPWNTDSVFFKIFNHKDFSVFKTSHVTVDKALAPNGPLKPGIINKIKVQMGDDISLWRREMEAEWVEDDNVWLTQSLIASCIVTAKTCGVDLEEFDHAKSCSGEFFGGLDLAQTKDYCVFSVVERLNDRLFLRHLKIFPQPTLYATISGYVKTLQDRWGGFEKIRVDFTREGPSLIADMKNAGIDNVEGVCFSVPRKSEMAGLLKQRMMDHRFFYPLLTWERPYRNDICTELNMELYDVRKDGTIGYSHPTGTHDDVFWSIALAVYSTLEMAPEPFIAVIPR